MPFRKKEAFRIDEENQRMIERIMNAHPSLHLKKMENDYQNHLQIKRNLMRNIPLPIDKLI